MCKYIQLQEVWLNGYAWAMNKGNDMFHCQQKSREQWEVILNALRDTKNILKKNNFPHLQYVISVQSSEHKRDLKLIP